MRQFWRAWRAWLPGPKHRVARGVAVHGSPGFRRDGDRLADALADCRNLRAWARERGVDLDNHPDSLARLDRALEPSTEDDRRILEMDGGLYLGTTMVRHIPGARWRIWPNGHPVVKLHSGRELDVVAIASNLAGAGESRLAVLYADAAADLTTHLVGHVVLQTLPRPCGRPHATAAAKYARTTGQCARPERHGREVAAGPRFRRNSQDLWIGVPR
jgi:Family of unknown function (DUF6278)